MADLSVYAHTTAIPGLARIDRLDLLALLPVPIVVTLDVWQENVVDLSKPGVTEVQKAREAGLPAVVEEGDPRVLLEVAC